MKRILILEDNEERVAQFNRNLAPNMIYVTDQAQEAIHKLKVWDWDILFLDHDLGGQLNVSTNEVNTGSTVAKWLANNPDRKPSLIIIHSWNTVGSKYMKNLLPESVIFPSAWVKITSENLTDETIKKLQDEGIQQYKRMLSQ